MRESQARPAPARADPIGQVSGVREAAGVDSPTLVMALARGYYEDPVFGWYFPDDSRRLQQLQRMFALFAAQVFGYGGAYTTLASSAERCGCRPTNGACVPSRG